MDVTRCGGMGEGGLNNGGVGGRRRKGGEKEGGGEGRRKERCRDDADSFLETFFYFLFITKINLKYIF